MQCRHEMVGPLDLLGLILQKSIIGVVVNALHEPDEHIGDIIESPCRLSEH
jgi:hypothetical protein